MKKLMKTILAATLLMSVSTVFAQNKDFGPKDRGPHQQHGMQGMPMIEHLLHALHQLDLSDEQITNIKSAMRSLKTEVGPILKETKANKERLLELVKAESFDQNAVVEIAQNEGNLAARRIVITSQTLSDIFGYLSADQRAQLDKMHTKRKQWRDAK